MFSNPSFWDNIAIFDIDTTYKKGDVVLDPASKNCFRSRKDGNRGNLDESVKVASMKKDKDDDVYFKAPKWVRRDCPAGATFGTVTAAADVKWTTSHEVTVQDRRFYSATIQRKVRSACFATPLTSHAMDITLGLRIRRLLKTRTHSVTSRTGSLTTNILCEAKLKGRSDLFGVFESRVYPFPQVGSRGPWNWESNQIEAGKGWVDGGGVPQMHLAAAHFKENGFDTVKNDAKGIGRYYKEFYSSKGIHFRWETTTTAKGEAPSLELTSTVPGGCTGNYNLNVELMREGVVTSWSGTKSYSKGRIVWQGSRCYKSLRDGNLDKDPSALLSSLYNSGDVTVTAASNLGFVQRKYVESARTEASKGTMTAAWWKPLDSCTVPLHDSGADEKTCKNPSDSKLLTQNCDHRAIVRGYVETYKTDEYGDDGWTGTQKVADYDATKYYMQGDLVYHKQAADAVAILWKAAKTSSPGDKLKLTGLSGTPLFNLGRTPSATSEWWTPVEVSKETAGTLTDGRQVIDAKVAYNEVWSATLNTVASQVVRRDPVRFDASSPPPQGAIFHTGGDQCYLVKSPTGALTANAVVFSLDEKTGADQITFTFTGEPAFRDSDSFTVRGVVGTDDSDALNTDGHAIDNTMESLVNDKVFKVKSQDKAAKTIVTQEVSVDGGNTFTPIVLPSKGGVKDYASAGTIAAIGATSNWPIATATTQTGYMKDEIVTNNGRCYRAKKKVPYPAKVTDVTNPKFSTPVSTGADAGQVSTVPKQASFSVQLDANERVYTAGVTTVTTGKPTTGTADATAVATKHYFTAGDLVYVNAGDAGDLFSTKMNKRVLTVSGTSMADTSFELENQAGLASATRALGTVLGADDETNAFDNTKTLYVQIALQDTNYWEPLADCVVSQTVLYAKTPCESRCYRSLTKQTPSVDPFLAAGAAAGGPEARTRFDVKAATKDQVWARTTCDYMPTVTFLPETQQFNKAKLHHNQVGSWYKDGDANTIKFSEERSWRVVEVPAPFTFTATATAPGTFKPFDTNTQYTTDSKASYLADCYRFVGAYQANVLRVSGTPNLKVNKFYYNKDNTALSDWQKINCDGTFSGAADDGENFAIDATQVYDKDTAYTKDQVAAYGGSCYRAIKALAKGAHSAPYAHPTRPLEDATFNTDEWEAGATCSHQVTRTSYGADGKPLIDWSRYPYDIGAALGVGNCVTITLSGGLAADVAKDAAVEQDLTGAGGQKSTGTLALAAKAGATEILVKVTAEKFVVNAATNMAAPIDLKVDAAADGCVDKTRWWNSLKMDVSSDTLDPYETRPYKNVAKNKPFSGSDNIEFLANNEGVYKLEVSVMGFCGETTDTVDVRARCLPIESQPVFFFNNMNENNNGGRGVTNTGTGKRGRDLRIGFTPDSFSLAVESEYVVEGLRGGFQDATDLVTDSSINQPKGGLMVGFNGAQVNSNAVTDGAFVDASNKDVIRTGVAQTNFINSLADGTAFPGGLSKGLNTNAELPDVSQTADSYFHYGRAAVVKASNFCFFGRMISLGLPHAQPAGVTAQKGSVSIAHKSHMSAATFTETLPTYTVRAAIRFPEGYLGQDETLYATNIKKVKYTWKVKYDDAGVSAESKIASSNAEGKNGVTYYEHPAVCNSWDDLNGFAANENDADVMFTLPGKYEFSLHASDACTKSTTQTIVVEYKCDEYTNTAHECVIKDATAATATPAKVAACKALGTTITAPQTIELNARANCVADVLCKWVPRSEKPDKVWVGLAPARDAASNVGQDSNAATGKITLGTAGTNLDQNSGNTVDQEAVCWGDVAGSCTHLNVYWNDGTSADGHSWPLVNMLAQPDNGAAWAKTFTKGTGKLGAWTTEAYNNRIGNNGGDAVVTVANSDNAGNTAPKGINMKMGNYYRWIVRGQPNEDLRTFTDDKQNCASRNCFVVTVGADVGAKPALDAAVAQTHVADTSVANGKGKVTHSYDTGHARNREVRFRVTEGVFNLDGQISIGGTNYDISGLGRSSCDDMRVFGPDMRNKRCTTSLENGGTDQDCFNRRDITFTPEAVGTYSFQVIWSNGCRYISKDFTVKAHCNSSPSLKSLDLQKNSRPKEAPEITVGSRIWLWQPLSSWSNCYTANLQTAPGNNIAGNTVTQSHATGATVGNGDGVIAHASDAASKAVYIRVKTGVFNTDGSLQIAGSAGIVVSSVTLGCDAAVYEYGGKIQGAVPFTSWSRNRWKADKTTAFQDITFDFSNMYRSWTGDVKTSADLKDQLAFVFSIKDSTGNTVASYDPTPGLYTADTNVPVTTGNLEAVAGSNTAKDGSTSLITFQKFIWKAQDILAAGAGTYDWHLTVTDGCTSVESTSKIKVVCDDDPAFKGDIQEAETTLTWQGRARRFGAETTMSRWYVSKRTGTTTCPAWAALVTQNDQLITAGRTGTGTPTTRWASKDILHLPGRPYADATGVKSSKTLEYTYSLTSSDADALASLGAIVTTRAKLKLGQSGLTTTNSGVTPTADDNQRGNNVIGQFPKNTDRQGFTAGVETHPGSVSMYETTEYYAYTTDDAGGGGAFQISPHFGKREGKGAKYTVSLSVTDGCRTEQTMSRDIYAKCNTIAATAAVEPTTTTFKLETARVAGKVGEQPGLPPNEGRFEKIGLGVGGLDNDPLDKQGEYHYRWTFVSAPSNSVFSAAGLYEAYGWPYVAAQGIGGQKVTTATTSWPVSTTITQSTVDASMTTTTQYTDKISFGTGALTADGTNGASDHVEGFVRSAVLVSNQKSKDHTWFRPDVAGEYELQLEVDDGCSVTQVGTPVKVTATCPTITVEPTSSDASFKGSDGFNKNIKIQAGVTPALVDSPYQAYNTTFRVVSSPVKSALDHSTVFDVVNPLGTDASFTPDAVGVYKIEVCAKNVHRNGECDSACNFDPVCKTVDVAVTCSKEDVTGPLTAYVPDYNIDYDAKTKVNYGSTDKALLGMSSNKHKLDYDGFFRYESAEGVTVLKNNRQPVQNEETFNGVQSYNDFANTVDHTFTFPNVKLSASNVDSCHTHEWKLAQHECKPDYKLQVDEATTVPCYGGVVTIKGKGFKPLGVGADPSAVIVRVGHRNKRGTYSHRLKAGAAAADKARYVQGLKFASDVTNVGMAYDDRDAYPWNKDRRYFKGEWVKPPSRCFRARRHDNADSIEENLGVQRLDDLIKLDSRRWESLASCPTGADIDDLSEASSLFKTWQNGKHSPPTDRAFLVQMRKPDVMNDGSLDDDGAAANIEIFPAGTIVKMDRDWCIQAKQANKGVSPGAMTSPAGILDTNSDVWDTANSKSCNQVTRVTPYDVNENAAGDYKTWSRCITLTVDSDTSLTCRMPQFKPPRGYQNKDYNLVSQNLIVEVEVLGLRARSKLGGIFSYEAGLEVTSVSPLSSPPAGGGVLTITGKNFRHANYQGDFYAAKYNPWLVMIGDEVCPLISQSETEIKCRIPANYGTNHAVTLEANPYVTYLEGQGVQYQTLAENPTTDAGKSAGKLHTIAPVGGTPHKYNGPIDGFKQDTVFNMADTSQWFGMKDGSLVKARYGITRSMSVTQTDAYGDDRGKNGKRFYQDQDNNQAKAEGLLEPFDTELLNKIHRGCRSERLMPAIPCGIYSCGCHDDWRVGEKAKPWQRFDYTEPILVEVGKTYQARASTAGGVRYPAVTQSINGERGAPGRGAAESVPSQVRGQPSGGDWIQITAKNLPPYHKLVDLMQSRQFSIMFGRVFRHEKNLKESGHGTALHSNNDAPALFGTDGDKAKKDAGAFFYGGATIDNTPDGLVTTMNRNPNFGRQFSTQKTDFWAPAVGAADQAAKAKVPDPRSNVHGGTTAAFGTVQRGECKGADLVLMEAETAGRPARFMCRTPPGCDEVQVNIHVGHYVSEPRQREHDRTFFNQELNADQMSKRWQMNQRCVGNPQVQVSCQDVKFKYLEPYICDWFEPSCGTIMLVGRNFPGHSTYHASEGTASLDVEVVLQEMDAYTGQWTDRARCGNLKPVHQEDAATNLFKEQNQGYVNNNMVHSLNDDMGSIRPPNRQSNLGKKEKDFEEWDSTKNYADNNHVTYNGQCWVARATTTKPPPLQENANGDWLAVECPHDRAIDYDNKKPDVTTLRHADLSCRLPAVFWERNAAVRFDSPIHEHFRFRVRGCFLHESAFYSASAEQRQCKDGEPKVGAGFSSEVTTGTPGEFTGGEYKYEPMETGATRVVLGDMYITGLKESFFDVLRHFNKGERAAVLRAMSKALNLKPMQIVYEVISQSGAHGKVCLAFVTSGPERDAIMHALNSHGSLHELVAAAINKSSGKKVARVHFSNVRDMLQYDGQKNILSSQIDLKGVPASQVTTASSFRETFAQAVAAELGVKPDAVTVTQVQPKTDRRLGTHSGRRSLSENDQVRVSFTVVADADADSAVSSEKLAAKLQVAVNDGTLVKQLNQASALSFDSSSIGATKQIGPAEEDPTDYQAWAIATTILTCLLCLLSLPCCVMVCKSKSENRGWCGTDNPNKGVGGAPPTYSSFSARQ
jgi:hypothetical protein